MKIFNPQNDKRKWYRKVYLKSEHWRNLRALKLSQHTVCEVCEKKQTLEPHHLRYRMIFDVAPDDLIAVCRKCHTQLHREINEARKISRDKKSLKKKRSVRLKAVNATLLRPPVFPIMYDKHGIPIVTTKILGKKFAPLRMELESALGQVGENLVGCAVPLSVMALSGVAAH